MSTKDKFFLEPSRRHNRDNLFSEIMKIMENRRGMCSEDKLDVLRKISHKVMEEKNDN